MVGQSRHRLDIDYRYRTQTLRSNRIIQAIGSCWETRPELLPCRLSSLNTPNHRRNQGNSNPRNISSGTGLNSITSTHSIGIHRCATPTGFANLHSPIQQLNPVRPTGHAIMTQSVPCISGNAAGGNDKPSCHRCPQIDCFFSAIPRVPWLGTIRLPGSSQTLLRSIRERYGKAFSCRGIRRWRFSRPT